MPIIGIYADFLSEEQKQQIEAIGKPYGYAVRYFETLAEVEAGIAECEVIYGYYPASILKKAEALRWFASASAGVDSYLSDSLYAYPEQVTLTNSAGSYGTTIAEHMLMVTLMLMRRQLEYTEITAARRWENVGAVRSIFGSRFVIVGTGDIGTSLARRVKALGAAHVSGVRRTLKEADPAFDEVVTLDKLAEVLPGADVLALCVPATQETKGLLSKEILAQMDAKTLVVNVGRGSAIDQAALVEALNKGRIAGAALDVTTPEPLPKDDPLYTAKNVIITPHISGNMSLQYTCDVNVAMFCRNLERYCKGEALHHTVDRRLGY